MLLASRRSHLSQAAQKKKKKKEACLRTFTARGLHARMFVL